MTGSESVRQKARDWCKARGFRFHESMVTFSEGESSLARKQEREECAKAVCGLCKLGNKPDRLKHSAGHFYWHHKSDRWQDNGDCEASSLHERVREDQG